VDAGPPAALGRVQRRPIPRRQAFRPSQSPTGSEVSVAEPGDAEHVDNMYQVRTPNCSKHEPDRRWALPDRVFFACGACHILAYAFLQRHGAPEMQATWIRPAPGFSGNHIFVGGDAWVFDYHGYSRRDRFLEHTWKRARQIWPGWDASLIDLPHDVLISEARSRTYDGLWLREPRQFPHDALPRAEIFLDRFPAPPSVGSLSAGFPASSLSGRRGRRGS
jgi:hypothetical protein